MLALVSFHSHEDRSFLDDPILALLSGDLRAAGIANDLFVVGLDGSSADPTDSDAFRSLVRALSDRDPIVYERIWDREIVAKLRAALPGRTFIACVGEHALADPPADRVCRGELRRTLPALLAELRGRSLEKPAPLEFTPNLRPIVIGPRPAALDSFTIEGNPGCPYQSDARQNPLYAGVDIPEGAGRGCAFCTTGNHYTSRPDVAEAVLAQIRYARRAAPELVRLRLKDQNPFAYLTSVLEACASEGLGGFKLMLETRADWMTRSESRFERALEAAGRAKIAIAPYLVGIESFAQAELDRFNKGTTANANVAFLETLRSWRERWPDVLDLSEASFGFVLFTPWTTLADLRANYDAVVRTRFDRLRGKLLLSRARLYPDTALYWLARRDGLLVDQARGLTPDQRWGYFPAHPWRFQHDEVARFAELATTFVDESGGKDELRIWRALHAAFDEKPWREITADDVRARMNAPIAVSSGRTSEVRLAGRCSLSCASCDCRAAPHDEAAIERALAAGGARLELRGDAASSDRFAEVVARARASGVREIVLRTHAHELAPDVLAAVDALLVPITSHVPAVHDRIAGKPGALVATLVGLRSAAKPIEIEVPLLPARLQSLTEIVSLVHRAASIRAVRFVLPRAPVPAAIAPPRWDREGAARLAEAIAHCRALGIAAPLPVTSGIPLCALRDFPDAASALSPSRKRRPAPAIEPCTSCAAHGHCAGVTSAYHAAHGTAGIAPFAERPPMLARKRRLETWTEERRTAARSVHILVLRPTVHCNQDCVFCSANETTKNVWADPAEMHRAIVRAAQRGIGRVSFSGGEPTLSKHLTDYVRTARRVGIRDVELVTNGVLLDERKVQALAEAGLSHAFVSLHAHDEMLSRAMTQKAGDFERTVRAIDLLSKSGVLTVINHVINARNYRYLTRFVELVRERFEGRVLVSFAFVTPQFKALENIDVVPRLSEVMPHLRRAMRRALALDQPFVVGSRQGVPPCQLGEFRAWSDAIDLVHESASEDTPQKVRTPGCDACLYARMCAGLWKPYAARYGTSELAPIAGPPIEEAERREMLKTARRAPWGVPRSFEDVPERLRDRASEGPLEEQDADAPIPVYAEQRSRPIRVLIAGTGARARQLARAMRTVAGLAIDSVASPHALDSDLREFDGAPAYTSAEDAMLERRPDAVIVASSTASHYEIAKRAAELGIPALVETPFVRTVEEAAELAAMDATIVVAEPGVAAAPNAWSKRAVARALAPILSSLEGALEVRSASYHGDARPESIRATLRAGERDVDIVWPEARPRATSEAAMLESFRDVVLGVRDARGAARRALEVVKATRALIDALERAGAPFRRPSAPKHVATRGLAD